MNIPATPRQLLMLTFPEMQTLDVTGPLEVFALATRLPPMQGIRSPGYAIDLVAHQAGLVPTSSGLELNVQRAWHTVRGDIDTLIVPGGPGAKAAAHNQPLLRWLRHTARRTRRLASVCTGAILLAEAGLLDHRRATTHWSYCAEFAHRYPQVTVEPDPIFVRDENVYTSAGITAGMDLALALVEEDLGREVALMVARWLVLFLKRPGGQAQFSIQLSTQVAQRAPLGKLQRWMLDHLHADLSVEALAQRACMSPRNFARVFTREVGMTPARFVEQARVEEARRQLEDTTSSVETIAAQSGFHSAERMRRAFLRTLHVAPSAYRHRFQPAAGSSSN